MTDRSALGRWHGLKQRTLACRLASARHVGTDGRAAVVARASGRRE